MMDKMDHLEFQDQRSSDGEIQHEEVDMMFHGLTSPMGPDQHLPVREGSRSSGGSSGHIAGMAKQTQLRLGTRAEHTKKTEHRNPNKTQPLPKQLIREARVQERKNMVRPDSKKNRVPKQTRVSGRGGR